MRMTAYRWAQKIGAVGIWFTAAAINEYFQLLKLNGLAMVLGIGMVATVMAIDRWQKQFAEPA